MYNIYEDNKEKIENIEYVKNLYDMQVYKVKKEQHIEKLLLEDYVRTIKSYTTRYDLLDIFADAQKQMGNKLKKDRAQFKMLKKLIMEDFLNNDKNFKLTNIIREGYESYRWRIEFEGYGESFYISIPVKKKLTTENIKYARYGMFGFSVKKNESYLEVIAESYKIEDIAQAIKNWFNI